jgi:hypothetical protein
MDGGDKTVRQKKTFTRGAKRVAAAILTMVALGATVSAPFKWSRIAFPSW